MTDAVDRIPDEWYAYITYRADGTQMLDVHQVHTLRGNKLIHCLSQCRGTTMGHL
jgi:hypothetical protein